MEHMKEIVKNIMECDLRARKDDSYLYLQVAKHIDPSFAQKSFADVMYNMRVYGLPPFETVRRYRQRLQSLNPDLAADGNTEASREIEKEKYIKIARMNA